MCILVWHKSFQTLQPIDQTECPSIVPKGFFQIENGFVQEHIQDSKIHIDETVYHSSLLKLGVSKRLELRLILETTSIAEQEPSRKILSEGLNPLQLGFKVNIFQEKGIIPMTSLIVHSSIPQWASREKRELYYAPNFRFTMQHTLSQNITVGYNLGSEWDGNTKERTDIYTLTSGFSLSQKKLVCI